MRLEISDNGKWWRRIAIAGSGLEALMLATGAPGFCFLLVGIGALMIGVVLPPWLDAIRDAFGPNRSLFERLIAWFAPWGVSFGFSLLFLSALAVLGGVIIGVGQLVWTLSQFFGR